MVVLNHRGDMRIQQMTFMILFVFIFFAVVALFFISFQMRGVKQSYGYLQNELAISSIETIANMPEFNCDSSRTLCLDEDKLYVLSEVADRYEGFWPVASIKVRMVYPRFSKETRCPSENCTFYDIYNSGQSNVQEVGTFVSICKKLEISGIIQERCAIGRLIVGVKLNEGD